MKLRRMRGLCEPVCQCLGQKKDRSLNTVDERLSNPLFMYFPVHFQPIDVLNNPRAGSRVFPTAMR